MQRPERSFEDQRLFCAVYNLPREVVVGIMGTNLILLLCKPFSLCDNKIPVSLHCVVVFREAQRFKSIIF